MRQSLPLMHFYSGKLLQFYSGVDTAIDQLTTRCAASAGQHACD
jgi:hypothetical protein